jgi:hypothetical protein
MRKAIVILMIPLVLPCCQEEKKSAAGDKMENEVKRRVEVAKKELQIEERGRRLKTIRIVGFVFLCSGATACLVWLGRPPLPDPYGRAAPSRITPPPQWRDFRPPRKGRVLDLGPIHTAGTAMQEPRTPHGRRNHEAPPRR